MKTKHFLSLDDLGSTTLRDLIARAIELKGMQQRGELHEPLRNKMLALIFEKSSTRTRVSFETGMTQLGGNSLFLSPRDSQLGRGEPVADTARVLSRMLDGIVVRTDDHAKVETFAAHSRVPIINALTDLYHPCQLLADIQTFQEHRGDIRGHTVAWIGDGNNVCHSWMNAARLLDFQLHLAVPEGYEPNADIMAKCQGHVSLERDPDVAVKDASVVVTDTWASMGQEQEKNARAQAFQSYKVTTKLMQAAAKDAIFMHCLPAYREYEVSTEVIDGPQSLVWDEAENRLHAQKALLEYLLT